MKNSYFTNFLHRVDRLSDVISYMVFPGIIIENIFKKIAITFFKADRVNRYKPEPYDDEAKSKIVTEILFDLRVRAYAEIDGTNDLFTYGDVFKKAIANLAGGIIGNFIERRFMSLIIWSFLFGPVLFIAVPFLLWREITFMIADFLITIEYKVLKGRFRRLLAKRALADRTVMQQYFSNTFETLSYSLSVFDYEFIAPKYQYSHGRICRLFELNPAPSIKSLKDFRTKYYELEDKVEVSKLVSDFFPSS